MNMHTIREWINRGCDPSEEYAPTIGQLTDLEGDNLIVRLEHTGGGIRWLLTNRGFYEADRCQHRDERAARESDVQRAARNMGRAARSIGKPAQ